MFVVLRQEIFRYDALLETIHSSSSELVSAINGDIALSDKIEALYDSLLAYKLPVSWRHQSGYESMKSLSLWIADLNSRCLFLRQWATQVRDFLHFHCASLFSTKIQNKHSMSSAYSQDVPEQEPRTEPRVFWLSAFIYPQGFLTAVQQMAARKYKVPVDTLIFNFTVTKENWHTKKGILEQIKDGPPPPTSGILVMGLYLDSAKWDVAKSQLDSLKSAGDDRFNALPEIHFDPRPAAPGQVKLSRMFSSLPKVYECPVYRTSRRAGILSSTGQSTNFITSVNLPSKSDSTELILRGVALLCQLDDRNES